MEEDYEERKSFDQAVKNLYGGNKLLYIANVLELWSKMNSKGVMCCWHNVWISGAGH